MIMKNLIILISLIGLLILTSCKKCKTCQCWKNGVVTEEENCAFGGGSSYQSLETWEQYLVEEVGYDSLKCVTE